MSIHIELIQFYHTMEFCRPCRTLKMHVRPVLCLYQKFFEIINEANKTRQKTVARQTLSLITRLFASLISPRFVANFTNLLYTPLDCPSHFIFFSQNYREQKFSCNVFYLSIFGHLFNPSIIQRFVHPSIINRCTVDYLCKFTTEIWVTIYFFSVSWFSLEKKRNSKNQAYPCKDIEPYVFSTCLFICNGNPSWAPCTKRRMTNDSVPDERKCCSPRTIRNFDVRISVLGFGEKG